MDKDIRLKGQREFQCENAELKCEGEIEALAASHWEVSWFPRFRIRARQDRWLSQAVTQEKGQSPHPTQHRPMKGAVYTGLGWGGGLASCVLTELGINVELVCL